jgi:hypothetical protein
MTGIRLALIYGLLNDPQQTRKAFVGWVCLRPLRCLLRMFQDDKPYSGIVLSISRISVQPFRNEIGTL